MRMGKFYIKFTVEEARGKRSRKKTFLMEDLCWLSKEYSESLKKRTGEYENLGWTKTEIRKLAKDFMVKQANDRRDSNILKGIVYFGDKDVALKSKDFEELILELNG